MINITKITLLAIFMIFPITEFNFSMNDSDESLATINVRIEKDSNDVWRVRDLNGNSQGALQASSNDRVQWQYRGRGNAIFSFSEDVADYFEFEEGMFEDGRTQAVGRNENLRVTIKDTAPRGELIYEVFIARENRYVQGNSAPRLIIR